MISTTTRQIVLDTETTGMNKLGVHYEGHRIIEIGAVEVINRRLTGRNFHVYIKPDRLVDRKRTAYTASATTSWPTSRPSIRLPTNSSTLSAAASW